MRDDRASLGPSRRGSRAKRRRLGAGEAGEAGLVPIWQLHQRYLFAQTRQGLLIIDQHAAHERVLYERALEHLRGMPARLAAAPLSGGDRTRRRTRWRSWREFARDLATLGLDGEEFGGRSVLLRGVPAAWGRDPRGALPRPAARARPEPAARGRDRAERLAAAWACRSAVRSGQPLTLEEMNALVDQLFATRLPHGDPHGRPTFLLVTLDDLDRRFGASG